MQPSRHFSHKGEGAFSDISVFLSTSPKDRRDARFASRCAQVYYFGMDELEISGKRYISTRRAAREHGYHSDYMGQLIRGKKVVGQKVGRSWYIEEGSLNAYLGHTEGTAEQSPVAAPAPVERLVVEEPVAAPAVVAQPAPVIEPVVQPVVQEVTQPVPSSVSAQQAVAVRAIYQEPYIPQASAPVQNISYTAPIQEGEVERRIPIHTTMATHEYAGGLKYADDDTPRIPAVTRMPQEPVYYQAPEPKRANTAGSTFPYVSLSVVAVISIVGALFASNFITATIVSEEGKSATVQYAIHW